METKMSHYISIEVRPKFSNDDWEVKVNYVSSYEQGMEWARSVTTFGYEMRVKEFRT